MKNSLLVFSPINLVLLKKNLKSVPQNFKINVEYADSKTSPLTKEDLASFKTLTLSYK
jgi:hypothetical protein